MKRVVGLVVAAAVIGLGVVVIARGFLVSEPVWPERVAIGAATLGLGLSVAAYILGVRRRIAVAGLVVGLAGIGYVEWISGGAARV